MIRSRPRVYIVCIRSDSMKTAFEWPAPAPLRIKAKHLLDHNKPDRKSREQLGNGAQHIFEKATNAILENGGLPEKEYWFVDVDSSSAFTSWTQYICPCITKGRGVNGFFTTHYKINGMMRLEEIMRLQGFDPFALAVDQKQRVQKRVGACAW